jgi:hypothetical protein
VSQRRARPVTAIRLNKSALSEDLPLGLRARTSDKSPWKSLRDAPMTEVHRRVLISGTAAGECRRPQRCDGQPSVVEDC